MTGAAREFAFTGDQEALRGLIRKFLAERAPLRPLPASPEEEPGFDRGTWHQLTGQLGVLDAVLPPGCGGSGGPVELAILAEEAGAALYGGPLLSASALALPMLASSGTDNGRAILQQVCSGGTITALAAPRHDPVLRGSRPAALPPAAGSDDSAGPARGGTGRVTAVRADHGDYLLSGTHLLALDGPLADVFLVAARGSEGVQLFAVARESPGISLMPMAGLDLGRQIAGVTLSGARAQLVAAASAAAAALAAARVSSALFLAAEQLGVAQHCLDASVAHARTRVQFGRTIGSFQAVKHKLADMLAVVEQARSAVYYAAWQAGRAPADQPDAGRDFAVAAAASFCAGAGAMVTAATIQLHGGTGFTWEHEAHRYFRRSHSDALLCGGAAASRRAAAAALETLTSRPRAAAISARAASGNGLRGAAADQAGRPDDPAGPAEHRELERAAGSWVRQNLPAEWLAAIDSADRRRLERARSAAALADWYARLGDSGWATPTWPGEHGGLALSPGQAAVVARVLDRYQAARPASHIVPLALAGPAILAWGTPEQRQRYLPGIARAQDMWCQLFSEPGAGSDLAALATRARPLAGADAGMWEVTGQKVWSSLAHQARYGLLLARTDPDQPKHRGITCFLLDMSSDGVDVRPLRQITGQVRFSEVFLTRVRVPDADRLGPAGQGWQVAASILAAERDSLSGAPVVGGGQTDELIAAARSAGCWADPVTRDRITALAVAERVLQMTNLRAYVAGQRGGRGAEGSAARLAEGSVTKLVASELAQRIGEAAAVIELNRSLAWPAGEPMPPAVEHLLGSRALTIAGGTSEIQRTIIADRVLGLEREPDPDRGRPWRDLRRG